MTLTPQTLQMRQLMVLGFMVFLFLFWIVPVTFLASLLSYEEIKKALPWLAKLIDSSDTIRALVQNSLPSVSMMLLNAVLPFLLEGELFSKRDEYAGQLFVRSGLFARLPSTKLD